MKVNKRLNRYHFHWISGTLTFCLHIMHNHKKNSAITNITTKARTLQTIWIESLRLTMQLPQIVLFWDLRLLCSIRIIHEFWTSHVPLTSNPKASKMCSLKPILARRADWRWEIQFWVHMEWLLSVVTVLFVMNAENRSMFFAHNHIVMLYLEYNRYIVTYHTISCYFITLTLCT